ncbi:MAG TPA: hypothetical protein PKE64_25875, partial [Anaerolineae bacterium]|nr:hypothetical protein [Anaerolineae bacterium]
LGLAEVVITVIRPDNRRDQVVSGSKPEHGVGGFELEAWEPGTYTLEFLGRRFHLNLLGRITRVTFHQVPRPVGAPASLIAAARERDPLLVVRGEEEISPEVESQRSFFNSLLTILTRWFNKNKSAAE